MVLYDFSSKKYKIEKYIKLRRKNGLKHHKTTYIYTHVVLTFHKGKVATRFAGSLFRIYIYRSKLTGVTLGT